MDLIRIVSENHEFKRPENCVRQIDDLEVWLRSEAYAEYCSFINIVNEATQRLSNTECGIGSDCVQAIVRMLDEFDALIESNPPINQPQRFGNAAFRDWHQAMCQKSDELLPSIVVASGAAIELAAYVSDSFGNPIRIDYGTGHELAFIMFLLCCVKIGVLAETDKRAIVGSIFNRYMQLVRRLQRTYQMEPAGSHGVWSLDDYQFVPFIWGSSQLIGNAAVKPAKMLDSQILDERADDYLFLQCIRYIEMVKRGPFHEHSNQLWNISGLPDWSLINSGLIKMYKDTVLNKFPIIQHVKFGSLISFRANRNDGNKSTGNRPRHQPMPIPAPPLFHQTTVAEPNTENQKL